MRDETLPQLIEDLAALHLVDPTVEAEAVRNVMVSPLAGIDPACADGREIARALEAKLRDDPALLSLPAKFGFAIDGGGVWPLGDAGADITLFADGEGQPWRIRLGGSADCSAPVPIAAALETLVQLAKIFCELAKPAGALRMRHLPATDVFRAAGLAVDGERLVPGVVPSPGAIDLSTHQVLAIGFPFGRIEASVLEQLAAIAPDAEFRLTPWRILAVSVSHATDAVALAAELMSCGLVVAAGDARLGIDACTGAPGCANGSTQTRQDAAAIAVALRGRTLAPRSIHVSGCVKGCAHRGSAPITAVARDGRYDLIRNGGPSDRPERTGIAPAALPAAIAELHL